MSRYVSILAGGSGTRLWPLIRSRRRKQLLALVGDRSLIQATVDRALPLVPAERILVITEASHAEDVSAQLPMLPPENIVVEPARRGTAAAVGLGAAMIAYRDPDATMASLHSDAAILDDEAFRRCLNAAFAVAEAGGWLVTLGIEPSSPHTGMGYIELGDPIGSFEGLVANRAVRFVEKPDSSTAQRFVQEGYVWNPGIFIWKVNFLRGQYARLLPEIDRPLRQIAEAFGTQREQETLQSIYPQIPVQTIDYGIMERADCIATIRSAFQWSDVGNWAEILALAPHDANGNVVRGDHTQLDTHQTLVYGTEKPIFTVGLHDIVIVDLPDALLVCSRDHAEQVKQLVEELQHDPRRASLL